MRRLVLLVWLVGLSACGSPGVTSGVPSPIPPSSSTPASASRTASPSPTAPVSAPPTGVAGRTIPLLVNFECRLPARITMGTIPGFLDLSNGQFASDPAAGSQNWVTYSWPAHRWLPVRYNQVAPDQMHYAYVGDTGSQFPPQSQGNLHVVDVAAGTDRILLKGGPWTSQESGVWGIIRYGTDGINIQKEAAASEGNWGVWLVDPLTGVMRQILPESIRNTSFGSGAAWTGNSTDVLSSSGVYRIDPSTGDRVLWFSKPNPWLWYADSDASGKPLIQWIQQAPAPSELWVLSGPSQAMLLYSGSQMSIPFPSQTATDARGVWAGSLSGGSALWLLTNDDKLIKVANTPIEVLGTCQ
jgi:hypothetical protein